MAQQAGAELNAKFEHVAPMLDDALVEPTRQKPGYLSNKARRKRLTFLEGGRD